jgi:putative transposase
MYRAKKNILYLTKKQYKFLRYLTRNSKNLYNYTLYQARQHYFNCNEQLNNVQLYKMVKDTEVYKSLPSDVAQQTINILDRNFKSFFALLKKKKNGQYNSLVKLPCYLDKQGYFPLVYPCRKGKMLNHFGTLVPKHLQKHFGFKKLTIPRPEYIKDKLLKEVRILPKLNYFEIEWVYEEQKDIKELDNKRVLGIDLGVDNFAACVDNITGRSFILDGRYMKFYNCYCNKKSNKMQKKSKNKTRLWDKRYRIFNDILNQYTNVIIQYCLHNNIGNIVIGQGYLAQNGCNLGNVNNQNFVNLPFAKFCQKIADKCEKYGITYITQEESYTSKCDHLAGEVMKHHNKYLGRRDRSKSFFHSSIGVLLNDDINGALGIIIKSKHEVDLGQLVHSGCLTQPSRIRFKDIKLSSAIQVINFT